jgi:hypothetical protein
VRQRTAALSRAIAGKTVGTAARRVGRRPRGRSGRVAVQLTADLFLGQPGTLFSLAAGSLFRLLRALLAQPLVGQLPPGHFRPALVGQLLGALPLGLLQALLFGQLLRALLLSPLQTLLFGELLRTFPIGLL